MNHYDYLKHLDKLQQDYTRHRAQWRETWREYDLFRRAWCIVEYLGDTLAAQDWYKGDNKTALDAAILHVDARLDHFESIIDGLDEVEDKRGDHLGAYLEYCRDNVETKDFLTYNKKRQEGKRA